MDNLKEHINNYRGKYQGSVNLKIVKYSSVSKSELFVYDKEKDIFTGLGHMYKDSRFNIKGSCTDPEKIKQNQILANNRAKAKIKNLIIENGLKIHCVTTYKDSVENRENTLKDNYRDIVLYDNKLFLKRLSYQLKHKASYAAVPEFQIDRFYKYGFKFLHMHIALSELVDERLFWSCWNSLKCMECEGYLTRKLGKDNFKCGDCNLFNGVASVKIDEMDLFKIANYFSKYFSKGFVYSELNQRKFNQKRYLNSFGLKMPTVTDVCISENELNYLIANCDYIKSMGLNNNVGSRLIIDNKILNLYLFGEKDEG